MDKKVLEFLEKINKKNIENSKFFTFGYQEEYREKENYDYGYIPFLSGLEFNEIERIIPLTNPNNRCGKMKESTEYIVVHDTASGAPSANAIAHDKWLMSMATNKESETAVSWHFTVDDNNIINHLPIDEVGYHAGDGTSIKLEFKNTHIKAKKNLSYTDVITSISDDGYFVINNDKTSILAPLTDDGKIVKNNQLPAQGINIKIGEDGNYLIGNTYWNKSYKTLANKGGNLNSVGIETCVNYGSDYVKTMRITAYLVAKLLNHYNLGLDRVKQHNSFSGKDCPMTMRHANRWNEFMYLVDLNLTAIRDFKDYKFEFKSLTPDYLDNSGKIIKHENGYIVKYQVIVSKNNETQTYNFESRLSNLNW